MRSGDGQQIVAMHAFRRSSQAKSFYLYGPGANRSLCSGAVLQVPASLQYPVPVSAIGRGPMLIDLLTLFFSRHGTVLGRAASLQIDGRITRLAMTLFTLAISKL